jgi:environmental stress-induced protein Ves
MHVQAPVAIASVEPIPWKNCGGTTRQLASAPATATTSDFLWRISVAQIDAPGDFSTFPGVDRTILLWRGDGVTLRSPAWPDHDLTDRCAPFHFRGEEKVTCDLLGGATQDLNLMVRRGKVAVVFEAIDEPYYNVPACDSLVVLCVSGSGSLEQTASGKITDIHADEFLQASSIVEDEAVVVRHDDALLIAIAIRLTV